MESRMSRRRRCRCQWRRSRERWRPCQRSLGFCCSPCWGSLSPFLLLLCKAFAARKCSNRHHMLSCPRINIWVLMIDPSSASFQHFYSFTISIKDSKVICLTLAKKGLAQRKRPKAANIMATEVHRVRLWILLRKGSAKMKQIWLISFPENTQAVSWHNREFTNSFVQTFDRIPNCFSIVERTAER